jgi:HAD superfamily hydrolase (TIGR01509 family)
VAADVRALLFDFDGLLVDTEWPAFKSWQSVYAAHGVELELARWTPLVGTLGHPFDPLTHLAELVGAPLDEADVLRRRSEHERALLTATTLRPGAGDYLAEARRRGLLCAIVTSNDGAWVLEHLHRLHVAELFALIEAADGDVARAKPAPALYLDAMARLEVGPGEVIVFEDSPNGVAAAKAAGAFCVAVPGPVTEGLDLSAADLRIGSMAELPLGAVIDAAQRSPAAG